MTSSDIICSFCGKGQQDALSLVSGVSVNPKGQKTAAIICDECVQLCVEVIARQHLEWLEQHRQFVMTLGK
jgi:ATP-dependent protease Clp ATPase subunit